MGDGEKDHPWPREAMAADELPVSSQSKCEQDAGKVIVLLKCTGKFNFFGLSSSGREEEYK